MTTINTNVGALQARTYAVSSGARQQTSMERLSSGLRINSAADDAAGLAVANKMKSQLRGLEMAVRNSMDGVSLIQTAEAAMGEVTNMVIRMRELAVQMHNGVYTDADRNNAQLEVEALKSEIDKVCANTAFNDVKLLDGSFETYFRAGDTNQEIVDVKIDGVCLDQLGGEYVDRRSISVIDKILPDEPTDTFLETVRFEKARTTIEASEASQVTIAQSELGISELPLPQSGQYSLRGIDANEFTIDTATGNITSVGAMDYEAPTGGVAADSTEYKFDVVFTASDGTEYIDEVTVKLLDGGIEPSTGGSVEVTLTEADNVVINTKGNRIVSENFKGFVKADSASGTFELSGTDADKFSVNADGVITAIGGLDFENPTGGISGNSNTYEFTYKYTSSIGQVYSETITLNVVDDPNEVSISDNVVTVNSHTTSSTARRVTTEIIPTYGDSLISEASTEFNLTETPSFTMELSNFKLLKNFTETFKGGTFNLSGLDVSNVSIDQQTGKLLLSSLDFENPNDSNTDNVYEFVINYEANGNIFIQNVKINIFDVALPNMIPATTTVEATEAQSISINAPGTHELSTEFLEYVSQNQGGVFSLRGTDGSLSNLSINSANGEIIANNLSFETPLDAGTNNSYEFAIEYCVNKQRVQENIILNIGDVGGEISSIGEVTKNVNYQSLIIHPYFLLNGETTSFFTNVESQVLDAGVVPRIAPMLEEFVNQNPGGTYTLTGLTGSGTLTYGVDFIVDPNTGEFVFDENQLSLADMGDYTMRLEYSSDSGNFIQDLRFLKLRTHFRDGISDNTIQTNTGTVSVDFVTGEENLIIDVVRDANNFPYIEAFYSAFSSRSADGLGNVLITNLRRNGESYSGGISVSNTGLLTLSNDLPPGTYTFSFETRGATDTMFTVTGPTELILDFTVTVANGDAVNPATKTVSSTSPTTPPVLNKVGQQGLATRLDYQITEARGFKVHVPEDVGDREELKKLIDANPRGAFALSGADAAKFTVDSDGMIKSQSQIDYERQSSYEFELTYTSGGASYKESYFLTVVDDPADNGKHLRDIGVGTRASSAEAVEILNIALDQLTASRAKLGAIENRLTYNISNLTKASMLTDQASGRITNADFAQETYELAKNQILNQASMAMLSQANQSKQNVLQLLG